MCWFFLLPVKVEGKSKLDPSSSYVFVANHQGAYDIFLIYGFIGRNFKWMMKKSIRRMPLFGKACESAKHIFTHVEWDMSGWFVEVGGEGENLVWVDGAALERYAVPSAFRVYLAAARQRLEAER